MEVRIPCGLWLLGLLLGCGQLRAFNLDEGAVLEKRGEPGSLFGYSMAMHRQLKPVDKRMLLVGAPRAKSLRGQTSNNTGGLYSCDMSSRSPLCDRVQFDNDEDIQRESKENQWMGVTVSSQGPGGKILTCAHRYQRRANLKKDIESRDIIGRCYVLSENLEIDPLSSEDGGSWHFCESRARGHEMFGSCQQGISATFDKDYHYLIFGAPGAYNWKGVVRLEQKNDTLLEMGEYDDGPYEAGDENQKNPNLVPAPPNSYLGFSLDSGMHLTKRNHLTVVAGAPRANHSGAVVLLKKGAKTSNILLEEYTLEGQGLASSFGYDLTVLDINKDGWQDIVVGAPQYFEKDKEIGGAVYVYINKAGNWREVKPIRMLGQQNSMFGLAVENLGDINQDGYQDFAVGAPYDEGAGKVYIYHGSAKGLSSFTASQVLSGKPLNANQFGYSLAGNMDLDKNTYPDLAVGSLSDSVFVYRARPVITIKKEIKFTPKEIDLTKKNCGNTSCVTIEACFSYMANPKSYAPRLTIAYTLAADAELRKGTQFSRATFTQPSASDNNYESKGTITFNAKGSKQCVTRQLAIQEKIRNKLDEIAIDVSVEIQDASRKRRQTASSQIPPVLDANEPMTTRAKVDFVKEGCGSDNVCNSNLQVAYRYGHLSADGATFTPLPSENGVQVISLSKQKDITLEVKATNMHGDAAHQASVVASIPRSLTYNSVRSPPNEPPVSCIANNNGSMTDCTLGNPFTRDSEATFYLNLGTAGISLDTTELEINLERKTTSLQEKSDVKAKLKVAIVLQLSLSGNVQPSQVYFSGDSKTTSTVKITHMFRIINVGKRLTDLGTAALHIDWPKEIGSGERLLYLMKINSTGMDQIECSPKGEINPEKESSYSRKKRATENSHESEEGIISRLADKRKSKILSCDDGVNCVRIKCLLRGLDSSADIMLHSRFWSRTFAERFSKFHHLQVIVKASLSVDSTARNMVLQNAETQVRLTAFPERRQAQYGGVPWWIIVLSILLGLLLLGLLAFLLWKCGFFQRTTYEDKVPSYSAVRIKREERINPGNSDWENLEKKPWMATWHDNEHYS